jgi:hypothetical protein
MYGKLSKKFYTILYLPYVMVLHSSRGTDILNVADAVEREQASNLFVCFLPDLKYNAILGLISA